MHQANSVPVTILTGFLGSGKTTVLNRLLKAPDLADTAVIVNEFGEVGVDHLLIEQAFENTVLLKNGCICCSVRGDVADTLATLFARMRDGTIPPFHRIVIETTGLADPAPVAHTLVTDGAAYACRLDGIVTTVDAFHGPAQLVRQAEARSQVAMADRIFVTKCDMADAAAAEAAVRRLNATAPMRRVVQGDVAADEIFGIGPQHDAGDARIMRWLAVPDAAPVSGDHHRHHHDEIATHLVAAEGSLRWADLRYWLDSILSTRGADILRLKGLVRIDGASRPLLLQAVHHMLYPLAWLERPPSARTEIVVIARGLSAAGLRASFAVAMGSGASGLR